jgi:hypothetical protein
MPSGRGGNGRDLLRRAWQDTTNASEVGDWPICEDLRRGATDWRSLVASACVFGVAGGFAGLLPVWRATRIDAAVILRAE